MKRRIDNILITIAVVSMLAFIVAGGFMTVYFKVGMVKEYGQEFTDVVQYFFAFGWIPAIAISITLNERKV